MHRHDPGAEPRLARPRRHALHGQRQIVPALHEPATPEHVTDDDREFIAEEIDAPTIVRRASTTTEAIRAYADSVALDPAHGIAQADGIRDARRRRAKQIAAQVVRDLDGHGEPRIVAALVLDALERDGVL